MEGSHLQKGRVRGQLLLHAVHEADEHQHVLHVDRLGHRMRKRLAEALQVERVLQQELLEARSGQRAGAQSRHERMVQALVRSRARLRPQSRCHGHHLHGLGHHRFSVSEALESDEWVVRNNPIGFNLKLKLISVSA